ncbi:hypothetical protein BDR06DRAFT_968446 [Suillus hirtellus]|nr:hypothetical protein BDR06DRAFT_968446 [Suillus hirtellus]
MAQWTYEWDGGSIISPHANRILGGSGEANSSLMKGISDGPARLSLANTTLRAHQMDSQPHGQYAIFHQGANRMSEVPGGPIIGTSSEPRVGIIALARDDGWSIRSPFPACNIHAAHIHHHSREYIHTTWVHPSPSPRLNLRAFQRTWAHPSLFPSQNAQELDPSVTVSETVCICAGPICLFWDQIHGGPIHHDFQDYMQNRWAYPRACRPTRSHILGPSVALFPSMPTSWAHPYVRIHACWAHLSKFSANLPGPFSPSSMQAHPVTHFGPTHLYGSHTSAQPPVLVISILWAHPPPPTHGPTLDGPVTWAESQPLAVRLSRKMLLNGLLTDLSFGEMLQKLQTYLGSQYCTEDWKEAVDSMFLTDGDVGKALIALYTIKGHYIPPPSNATTTSNSSLTHPCNPLSASIWDNKVTDFFTWFNDPDLRLSGKWMVTVPVVMQHTDYLIRDVGKLRNEHHLFKGPGSIKNCKYKGQKYVHGMLAIECNRMDIVTLSLPTAQDIALHMQSGCDPEFLAASMYVYSAQYWIEGDEVQVISGAMSGSWGLILDINVNDGTALVDLAYVPGSNDTLLNIEDLIPPVKLSTAKNVGALPDDDDAPMRGDHVLVQKVGSLYMMTGTVMDVDSASDGYSNITVPIIHAAKLNEGLKHDPMAWFIGKQVADSESGTCLDEGRLSDEQLQAFIQMLRRSYMPEAPRACTPPPSPPPDPPAQLEPATNPDTWSNPGSIFMPMASGDLGPLPDTPNFDPWKINPEDREDMLKGEPDIPESSSTCFLRSSSLSPILAQCSLVLRVLPVPNGWYQNYHDCLVHTMVPDPFLLLSGLVEDGNVAVTYVSRSKPPTGKGKDFVLICVDHIGTIHTMKKVMRDAKKVTKDSNVITTMEGKTFLHVNACLLVYCCYQCCTKQLSLDQSIMDNLMHGLKFPIFLLVILNEDHLVARPKENEHSGCSVPMTLTLDNKDPE